MAIFRFISRKAQLQGDNDTDYAKSEMLIEESVDIVNAMGKANSSSDRKAEMDKFFAEYVPQQLACLEKLAQGIYPFFFSAWTYSTLGTTLTGKTLAGDLAIFSVLDVLTYLQKDCLDKFPKIKAFYSTLAAHPKLKDLIDDQSIQVYYQRQ